MIVDECATFMIASIQNLTVLLYNIIFELIQNKEVLDKARNEIKNVIKSENLKDIDWI
jgi:cytochrome P450